MANKNKQRDNEGPELFPGAEKKSTFSNLADHEIEYIWSVFINENNNAIKRIAEITGYSKTTIDKVFELKTKTRGSIYKDKTRHSHEFAESKFSIPLNVIKYFYNHPEFRNRYKDISVTHYVRAVLTWTEINGNKIKRTDTGWKATIRKFIDSDIQKGKAVYKEAINKSRRNF